MYSFQYGNQVAQVTDAKGLSGLLCRSIDGHYFLRVDTETGYIDYEIRHDDLQIKIEDDLAACYETEGNYILDHSPQVLGLKPVTQK
jgi:hypothetical protein